MLENQELKKMLRSHIVEKIISIPIPVKDIQDKMIWKFITDGNFQSKLSHGQIIILPSQGHIVKSDLETEANS